MCCEATRAADNHTVRKVGAGASTKKAAKQLAAQAVFEDLIVVSSHVSEPAPETISDDFVSIFKVPPNAHVDFVSLLKVLKDEGKLKYDPVYIEEGADSSGAFHMSCEAVRTGDNHVAFHTGAGAPTKKAAKQLAAQAVYEDLFEGEDNGVEGMAHQLDRGISTYCSTGNGHTETISGDFVSILKMRSDAGELKSDPVYTGEAPDSRGLFRMCCEATRAADNHTVRKVGAGASTKKAAKQLAAQAVYGVLFK